jgi:hypothetical protein
MDMDMDMDMNMDISTSKIDIKLEKFKKYLHVMKENEKKNKRSVQFIN